MLLLDASLRAQQVAASAIDASGKRHFESREFPGLQKFVMPVYSHGDRLTRRQGIAPLVG
jgi:hypothetical protein